MERLRTALVLGSLIGAGGFLGGGCGANSFDGSTYRGDGFSFRVPPPPASWERLNVPGSALAFHDRENHAVIAVGARCGKDNDVPLRALTAHLFLQFTDREIESQQVIPFDGREAIRTVLDAKLDGVPQKFNVWVLKKDGCVYDLQLIAPPEHYAVAAPPFEQFVRGFSALSGHVE